MPAKCGGCIDSYNSTSRKSNLEITEDEMEIEWDSWGTWSMERQAQTCRYIANEMVDRLIADPEIGSGDRLSVMVNSLGATL